MCQPWWFEKPLLFSRKYGFRVFQQEKCVSAEGLRVPAVVVLKTVVFFGSRVVTCASRGGLKNRFFSRHNGFRRRRGYMFQSS